MLRWISLFANRLPKGVRRKRARYTTSARRLSVEALEDRRMLATITVTSSADNLDIDGLVTLREAIQAANTDMSVDGSEEGNGADVIKFDNSLSGDTITLAGQELEITESLSVDAGDLLSRIKIDANSNSRIFNISAITGDYSLINLELREGSTSGDNMNEGDSTYSGGAVRSLTSGNLEITDSIITESSTNGAYSRGGGVFAEGNVTVTGSTISNNSTDGTFSRGGGIFADGTLSITRSTISGNETNNSFSGGGGIGTYSALMLTNSTVSANNTRADYSPGGGIRAGSSATIQQSTISGNGTEGSLSNGGGIASFDTLAIHNSTISDNDVEDLEATGGGVWNQIFIIPLADAFVANGEHDVEIANTILATNTAGGGNPDLRLNHTDLAVHYSLIGDTSNLTIGQLIAINLGPGNKLDVDPLLGELANNGGETHTQYLLPGSPAIDMGDPTVLRAADEFDQRGNPFLRVFNDRLDMGAVETIVDDQGPQVNDLYIFGYGDFNLLDPKPSEHGPTPLVTELAIEFVDFPVRDAVFMDEAVDTTLVENEAYYSLVGDASGIIPIQSAELDLSPIGIGQPATATVVLTFFEPLPDDRFTLTVHDDITDPTGNKLDGESTIVSPFSFPSGDGNPGGDFLARFTIDSRAEIGTWGAGSVLIDANGNFVLDLANLDFTNRDLAFRVGYGSDYVFAGKFSVRPVSETVEGDAVAMLNGIDGGIATGFDTLAAYGRVSTNLYRWIIDTDDNGVVDKTFFEPAGQGINGYPVAGEFDGNPENGDEVGLFDGRFWYFDTDHDFNVSDETPIQAIDYSGFPIAGDFDGDVFEEKKDALTRVLRDFDFDGDDDVATYIATSGEGNLFSVDLNIADPGDPILIDGVADYSFYISTPGTGPFGFPGVRERPVAADFNADGIDDFGIWFPDGFVTVPDELSEWFLLLSGDDPFTPDVEVSVLDRIELGPLEGFVPFSPEPFANDLYAQFGNTFSLPIAGNFDPPATTGPVISVSPPLAAAPVVVPEVVLPKVQIPELPPVEEKAPETPLPTAPQVEQQPEQEDVLVTVVQVTRETTPEVPLEPTTEEAIPVSSTSTGEEKDGEAPKQVDEEIVKTEAKPEQPEVVENEPALPPQPKIAIVVESPPKEPKTPEAKPDQQLPPEPFVEEEAVETGLEAVVVEVLPQAAAETLPVAKVDPPATTRFVSRVRSLSYGTRAVSTAASQEVPPQVVKPPVFTPTRGIATIGISTVAPASPALESTPPPPAPKQPSEKQDAPATRRGRMRALVYGSSPNNTSDTAATDAALEEAASVESNQFGLAVAAGMSQLDRSSSEDSDQDGPFEVLDAIAEDVEVVWSN